VYARVDPGYTRWRGKIMSEANKTRIYLAGKFHVFILKYWWFILLSIRVGHIPTFSIRFVNC